MSVTPDTVLAVEHALRHALEAARTVRKKADPSASWGKVMPPVLEELRSALSALAEPEVVVEGTKPKRARASKAAPDEPPLSEVVDIE